MRPAAERAEVLTLLMENVLMVDPKRSARDSARWSDSDHLWLDHVTLVEEDLSWLAKVRWATFWNVKYPAGFLSRLPNLEYLDVRGGSGANADFIVGCTSLRYLTINQVRGLTDLSAIADAIGLYFLSLYGLPRVTQIPSLKALRNLDRAEIGSMKGLDGISGLLRAPLLTELLFHKTVGVTQADAEEIATHHSIRKFAWFAEDVPERIYVPFVERVAKPSTDFDWWERKSRQPR